MSELMSYQGFCRTAQASQFGPIWSDLDLLKAIERHLEPFGAISSHLKPFGATWSNLEQFGLI